MLWRVYIDEAGDRGIRDRSSLHFVLSAIIVPDATDAQARRNLGQLRSVLGRQPTHVLHFQKLTHSHRLKATQDLATFPIAAITSAILCKRGFSEPDAAGDLAFITNPDPMYLWAVRLLLERVSWFIRDHGGGSAVVTFAHVRRFQTQKLHDYRRALENTGTEIYWPAFAGHPFGISAPSHIEMLQLADIAASAIFRAVEPDEFGNPEPRYLRELGPKIYRRGSGAVTSYGLKVFPSSEAAPGRALHWLRSL